MSNKKILVTGSAGFIGYHLCKALLRDGYEILGIDNINDYYNPNLKLARIERLKLNANFKFEKVDIANREDITRSFQKFNPKKVVNLAAQAGVRYSIKNPYDYMESNMVGFLNIIELCRHNEVDGLIYVPYTLSEWGVAKSDLPQLVDESFTKGRMDNNIVDLTKDQVLGILKSIK